MALPAASRREGGKCPPLFSCLDKPAVQAARDHLSVLLPLLRQRTCVFPMLRPKDHFPPLYPEHGPAFRALECLGGLAACRCRMVTAALPMPDVPCLPGTCLAFRTSEHPRQRTLVVLVLVRTLPARLGQPRPRNPLGARLQALPGRRSAPGQFQAIPRLAGEAMLAQRAGPRLGIAGWGEGDSSGPDPGRLPAQP